MAECSIKDSTDKLPERRVKPEIADEDDPFRHLKIKDSQDLRRIKDRTPCDFCQKSRKFFCYTCYHPVISCVDFPRVKLPIKIDIIKHPREIAGKSTAVHAAIIAPADVKIYTYPDFPEIPNKEETVLVFPSKDSTKSISVEDLFTRQDGKGDVPVEKTEIWPIKRAIFIDSTWHQTKSIYKDQRLRELRCVILKSRISQFWRHQKDSPRWYLATIESIHQFLVELHTYALGVDEGYKDLKNFYPNTDHVTSEEEPFYKCSVTNSEDITQKYNGQYDNLLYFFKYMFEYIHSIYEHDQLRAYKRPCI